MHQKTADEAVVAATGAIEAAVDADIAANADSVEKYRGGKTALLGFFVGQVMKAMKGRGTRARERGDEAEAR